jgi:hypothetical protein
VVLRVFRVVVLPPPVRLQVSRSQKALSASSHPRPPGAARARLAAHRLHTVTGPAAPRARARRSRPRPVARSPTPPAPRGAFFPCGLRSKVGLRISKPLNLNHAKRKPERNLPLWRHSDVLGVAAQSACPLTVSPAASCVSLTKTEIGRVMDPAAVNVLFQVVHDWPCPASRYLRWPLRPSRARQTMPSGYCCASLARHRSSSSYLDGFLV